MKVSILHIGKTAGTALFSALREANHEKNMIFHGHAVSLEGLWKQFPQRNVMFGVREPIARYISAFNSRLREGKPRHYTPWSKSESVAFSLFKTPNDLAEALDSKNTLEKAVAELSMLGIKHVNKPLVGYLGDTEHLEKNKKKIKFVYLTESLNQDFEIMKDMLSLGKEVTLPGDEVSAHKMPSDMSRDLSERARKNLTRWYQDDFRMYDYCQEMHHRMVKAS